MRLSLISNQPYKGLLKFQVLVLSREGLLGLKEIKNKASLGPVELEPGRSLAKINLFLHSLGESYNDSTN